MRRGSIKAIRTRWPLLARFGLAFMPALVLIGAGVKPDARWLLLFVAIATALTATVLPVWDEARDRGATERHEKTTLQRARRELPVWDTAALVVAVGIGAGAAMDLGASDVVGFHGATSALIGAGVGALGALVVLRRWGPQDEARPATVRQGMLIFLGPSALALALAVNSVLVGASAFFQIDNTKTVVESDCKALWRLYDKVDQTHKYQGNLEALCKTS